MTQTTDARGSSGTIYAGYDGLNRQVWRNTSNSPTDAYTTYSYDSTSGGNQGVGRLTGETFSGALGSGSYSYTYDARGQTTNSTLTVGANSYPVDTTYDDAGQALTLTYPTGETVTAAYSAAGWLGSLTRTLGGTPTTLLDAIGYTGSGGATGQMTSAHVGNATYTYSASFDVLARPTDVTTQRASDGATLFKEAPSYDALGNISSETLTLPTGTDTQAFCYDDFQSADLGRIGGYAELRRDPNSWHAHGRAIHPVVQLRRAEPPHQRPTGQLSYGDSAHLDAATQMGSGGGQYTASYDASGDMTCRAPDGSTTCRAARPRASNSPGITRDGSRVGRTRPAAQQHRRLSLRWRRQPRRTADHHRCHDHHDHLCRRP